MLARRSWVVAWIWALVAWLALAPVPTATAQTAMPEMRPFKSARFTMDMVINMMGIEMKVPAEGEVLPPSTLRMKMKMLGQSMEMITIDGATYMKSALFKDPDQWYFVESDESSGPDMTNPLQTLRGLEGGLTVVKLPDEAVDGALTEHYQAEVDTDWLALVGAGKFALGQSPGGGRKGAPSAPGVDKVTYNRMEMEFWVAKDTRYPVKQAIDLDLTMELSSKANSSAASLKSITMSESIVMKFSDFDKPVQITAPANALPLPKSP